MYTSVKQDLQKTLKDIQTAGLYKRERLIDSPQASHVLSNTKDLINFCSNNYIGLANNSAIISAAKESLDINGFGMASVRFICGTQSQHDELESRLSSLLGTDATILFPSCFDANGGVFEVLLDQDDAVISDELNHASIIDGIRLCKATRYRYKNRDMADLEAQLVAARGARRTLIVTDGVFSMDGSFAPLQEICDLADKYEAMVMVDDSHAVGFIGATGAGTPEKFGVRDRVDIISGTLGKALGGASGGYISAHQEIVDLLRQRARPYLFSNSIPQRWWLVRLLLSTLSPKAPIPEKLSVKTPSISAIKWLPQDSLCSPVNTQLFPSCLPTNTKPCVWLQSYSNLVSTLWHFLTPLYQWAKLAFACRFVQRTRKQISIPVLLRLLLHAATDVYAFRLFDA
jgi:7-keto-8-aminopelargonate synthetase-like enzyme